MGKRATGRRLAMQILYQAQVGKFSIEEVLRESSTDDKITEEAKSFAAQLAKGVIADLGSIDALIQKYAKDWKLERLSEVDKSILRLAIYELTVSKENPASVIINEAVELAKKYSTPESSRFINGILGSILKAK